jgi:hypothetical protein
MTGNHETLETNNGTTFTKKKAFGFVCFLRVRRVRGDVKAIETP